MSKFPRSRHPLCILAYIYIRQGAQEKERRQSRIGLFDGIRMNGSTASSYATRKGNKKKEGNKNCWITLPDRFMRRTREKPPSAMTWQGRSPARIAKLLSPVKFEKICVPLRPHLLRPRTSPVVANGSF